MSKPPPEPLYTFRGSMSHVHCLLPRISDENELLYAGTTDGIVHVWDLKMKREVTQHNVGSEACLSILFNDNFYITQIKADSIKFWTEEAHKWKLSKIIKNDYCGFCNMSLLQDLIFLPDNDSKIIIYDFKKNKEVHLEEKKKLGQIMCLKSINILDCLLAAYESGDVHLYSSDLKPLSCHQFSNDCPMALDFCDTTMEGVIGNTTDMFFKFKINKETRSIEKVGEGKLTNPGIGSVAINEEGTLCVLGCWDGRLRYFTMKKLKLLAVLSHHTEAIQCVLFVNKNLSFSTKGLVIAGGKDTRISLWNLYTANQSRIS